MLLRLRHIARFYGPRLVFKDVSLDIARGGVTLLAGANGAGKSTLLKIMAGLIRPSAGVIHAGDGEREARIGYLGHQTFIYPELSALENLRFWAGMHGLALDEDRLLDILERMELKGFAEEKAGTFSRGMAQRLNLARVFMLRPELLLLDEPATGLDTRSSAILHREIAAARERGAGVVWITHSLEDDLKQADFVARLENKRLTHYGPATSYASGGRNGREAALEPDPVEKRRAQGGELC